MKRFSKAIMAIGTMIALLAVCRLDSPGVYGYLAGAVAILGGFVVGVGYALRLLSERQRECRLYFIKVDEWIEEGRLLLEAKK